MTAEVRPVAGDDDWSVVAWLWQAFKHDLAPIVGAYPGADLGAGRFWRLVADETLADWTEESRAVPGKPDVPPDTWISGNTLP